MSIITQKCYMVKRCSICCYMVLLKTRGLVKEVLGIPLMTQSSSYSSEDIALPEVVKNCVKQETGHPASISA